MISMFVFLWFSPLQSVRPAPLLCPRPSHLHYHHHPIVNAIVIIIMTLILIVLICINYLIPIDSTIAILPLSSVLWQYYWVFIIDQAMCLIIIMTSKRFINYNFESTNPWSEYFCSQQIHFTKFVLSGHTKATQSEQYKRVRNNITF